MSVIQQTPYNISADLEVVDKINTEEECENISPKLLFPDEKAIASPTDVMNIDDIEDEQSSKSNDKEELKTARKEEVKTTTSEIDIQMNIKKALEIYQIRMSMFFDPTKMKSFISMEDLEKEHIISKNQAYDNDINTDEYTDELSRRIEELYATYKTFLEDKKRQQKEQIAYETAKKYEKRVLNSYKEGMGQLFKNLVSGLSQEELESYHSNLMSDVLKILDDPQDVGSNKKSDKNLKIEVKQQLQERYEIYLRWYKEFKAKEEEKRIKEEERWAREVEQKVKEQQRIKAKGIMNKTVSSYKVAIEKNITDISIDTEKVSECHRKLLSKAKEVLEREIKDENIIDTYRKEMIMQIENHYVYVSAITNERIVRENEKRALKQYVSSMDKIVMAKGPYKPLSSKEISEHHDKVMVKINKYYNGAKEYGDIVHNSKRDLMVQINDNFKRYVALNEERRHMKKMSMKRSQRFNIRELKQSIQEFNISALKQSIRETLDIRDINKPLVIGFALALLLISIIYQMRLNTSATLKAQKALDYSMDRYTKGMNKIIYPESLNVSKVELQLTHEDLYMDALDLFDNLAADLGTSKRQIQHKRSSLISSILKTYESYENLNDEKARAIEGEIHADEMTVSKSSISKFVENGVSLASSGIILATIWALFTPRE